MMLMWFVYHKLDDNPLKGWRQTSSSLASSSSSDSNYSGSDHPEYVGYEPEPGYWEAASPPAYTSYELERLEPSLGDDTSTSDCFSETRLGARDTPGKTLRLRRLSMVKQRLSGSMRSLRKGIKRKSRSAQPMKDSPKHAHMKMRSLDSDLSLELEITNTTRHKLVKNFQCLAFLHLQIRSWARSAIKRIAGRHQQVAGYIGISQSKFSSGRSTSMLSTLG